MEQQGPEADAFVVLLSSQSGKRRNPTDQKDKYAACPVCGTNVPKAFLQSHTDDCCTKGQIPSQPTEQQHKVPRTDTRQSPTGPGTGTSPVKVISSMQQLFRSPSKPAKLPSKAATAAAGPDASQRPFLSPKQRLPPDEFRAMVSAGWDKALRNVPGALEEPAAQPQQQQQQQAQLKSPAKSPSHALPAQHRGPAAAGSTQGAVDAFAVLRSAQAAQVPMEAHMFLEGRGDGSYLFHWRLAGSAWAFDSLPEEPAWSATANANLPRQQHAGQVSGAASGSSKAGTPAGSVKLRLQISTNIPPGFGAAVDWENPLLPSNGFACSEAAQAGYQAQGSEQDDGSDWEQQHAMQGGEAAAEAGCSSGEMMRWRGDGSGALISALQKSVRRGCAASATRIALELLKDPKNAEALTRRLSIICLEDGLLHPQLPLVVWTMMALSKGYVIGGHLANALLTVTHQMASMQYRDYLPLDPPPVSAAGVYTAPATWHVVDAALGVSSQESVMVKCMLIRAAYGGMACDRDMLLAYAGLWTARFSGSTLPPPPMPAAEPAPAAAAADQPDGYQQQVQQLGQQVGEQQQQERQGQQGQEHEQQQHNEGQQDQQRQLQDQLVQEAGQQQQPQEQYDSTQQGSPEGLERRPASHHPHCEWLQHEQQEGQHRQDALGGSTQLPDAQQEQQQTAGGQSQQQRRQGPQQQEASLGGLEQADEHVAHQQGGATGVDQREQQQEEQSQPGYDLDSEPSQQQQLSGQHSPSATPVPNSPSSQENGPPFSTASGGMSPSRSAESPGSTDRAAGAGADRVGVLGPVSSAGQGSPQTGGSQGPCSSPQQVGSPVRNHEAAAQQSGSPAPDHAAGAEGGRMGDKAGRLTSSAGRGRDGSSSGVVRSTWLQFLQQQYSELEAWGLQRVTVLGFVSREDIHLAAVDMHVAPALTQHLKEQPQLRAAVRSMIAASTSVAARLSAPDGFDGLINSALWHFRSSVNRKAWLQAQYLHAAAAAGATAGVGGTTSRQQLEAAATAAVAAWQARSSALEARPAAGDGAGGSTVAALNIGRTTGAAAAATPRADVQSAVTLPLGAGFSEGAFRVLEMELNGLMVHEAQQRQTKQELMPLWRAGLAPLADAWCREYVSRRLY